MHKAPLSQYFWRRWVVAGLKQPTHPLRHIYRFWPAVTCASTKIRAHLAWTLVRSWRWRLLRKSYIMNVILSGRNAGLSVDVLKGNTLVLPPPPQLICQYTRILAIKSFLQIYSHTFYTLLRFFLLQQLLHIDMYSKLIMNVVSDITSFMFDFSTL